jgi:hypothetical protein
MEQLRVEGETRGGVCPTWHYQLEIRFDTGLLIFLR